MRRVRYLSWRGFLLLLVVSAAGTVALADTADALVQGVDDPYAVGLKLKAEKKYAPAAEMFAKAVKEDPGFTNAYIELARALTLSGRRSEGLQQLEQALKVAKKKSEREKLQEQRRLLAEIFFTNDTFQKYQDGVNLVKARKLRAAIRSFEQALAQEPENLAVLFAYGSALQDVDDWNESIKVLEQALKLNEEDQRVRLRLGQALVARNPERSVFLLKPLATSEASTEDAALFYARALFHAGKLGDAITVLRQSVESDTTRVRSLYWLGKFYAEQAEGAWQARRFLMTFLKRAERIRAEQSKDEAEPESDLTGLRVEAKKMLDRINRELGVGSLDG